MIRASYDASSGELVLRRGPAELHIRGGSAGAHASLAPALANPMQASFTFYGFQRYPAETRTWTALAEGDTAYYRDVAGETDAGIADMVDGDHFRVEHTEPDGYVSGSVVVTYRDSYNGQSSCLVWQGGYQCGWGNYIELYYNLQVQCAMTGWYEIRYLLDDAVAHRTRFKLAPHLPPGVIPHVYNQGDYPTDPYDSACVANGASYRCKGAPGETKRTISQKGCALASSAMMLEYFGRPTDPVSLNDDFNAKGVYEGAGSINFTKLSRVTDGTDTRISVTRLGPGQGDLRNAVGSYGPQVVEVEHVWGTGRRTQHFVLATGYDDTGHVLAVDPNGGGVGPLSSLDYPGGVRSIRLSKGPEHTDTIAWNVVVTFHSPGELLLTDPAGHRIGFDPVRGRSYAEIADAVYDSVTYTTVGPTGDFVDDDAERVKELYLNAPIVGDYTVTVTGTSSGQYQLYLTTAGGQSLDTASFRDVPISAGQVHSYRFHFDPQMTTGGGIELSGSFGGGGQGAEVDGFLTYSRPAQRWTALAAGTSAYSLMIFYDPGVLPASFQAVLNGVDITSSFHIVPGSHEAVSIPLQAGTNVLNLSVQGSVGSRTATDKDRLVFNVGR